ncbi:MAG: TRAP transporter permease [Bacillota bacterium]
MKEEIKNKENKINQKELLEKYDTEARFRDFSRNSIPGMIVFLVSVGLSLFHLYTAWQGSLTTLIHRAIHTSIILALVFVLYPSNSEKDNGKPSILDWVFSLISIVLGGYILFNYHDIVMRAGMPNNLDIIFGITAILTLLEGARRIVGKEIVFLAILFLAYAYFGRSLPGVIAHRGYNIAQISEYMYLSTEGIFGIAIGVSSTYIFLFILFGSFLQSSGMGQLFNDLSMAIAGSSKGGPAKVAVVSSGFLGSINGSAIANVVTTGAFTIPLMKKIGYKKNFAGAVEATASCGGQILPPVMGAAAFIMAEYLGISYITIAISAIIPALLYYLGVITMIHFRASKNGLEGMDKDQLPNLIDVLKERGYLLIPIIGLIYMLVKGRTPINAAFFSIILTITLNIIARVIKKETDGIFMDIINALEEGARTALGVAISCAVVGIIIGVATLTGFGLKLAGAILFLGNGILFLTLFFTMIACIVLGMGLPSIPAYIITATMAAPALSKMGVPPLVAHMFVFYFGILANLTPPVALAAFAGAGIAGGNPTKTGLQAVKLASAGFVVPYIFAFSPELLMINASPITIIIVAITAIIGVISLGAALEGYIIDHLNTLSRVILLIGAILLMIPGITTDILGLIIFISIVFYQKKISKENEELVSA